MIKLISESYNCTATKFDKETQNIIKSKDGHVIDRFWREQETIIGLEFCDLFKDLGNGHLSSSTIPVCKNRSWSPILDKNDKKQ